MKKELAAVAGYRFPPVHAEDALSLLLVEVPDHMTAPESWDQQ
jgi:hypothetical protein